MRIKSLTLDATVRLEKFCKLIKISNSSELTDDPEIHLYDFWLDDEKLNFMVNSQRVYFYTHDYDCTIYRDEFQEIQII